MAEKPPSKRQRSEYGEVDPADPGTDGEVDPADPGTDVEVDPADPGTDVEVDPADPGTDVEVEPAKASAGARPLASSYVDPGMNVINEIPYSRQSVGLQQSPAAAAAAAADEERGEERGEEGGRGRGGGEGLSREQELSELVHVYQNLVESERRPAEDGNRTTSLDGMKWGKMMLLGITCINDMIQRGIKNGELNVDEIITADGINDTFFDKYGVDGKLGSEVTGYLRGLCVDINAAIRLMLTNQDVCNWYEGSRSFDGNHLEFLRSIYSDPRFSVSGPELSKTMWKMILHTKSVTLDMSKSTKAYAQLLNTDMTTPQESPSLYVRTSGRGALTMFNYVFTDKAHDKVLVVSSPFPKATAVVFNLISNALSTRQNQIVVATTTGLVTIGTAELIRIVLRLLYTAQPGLPLTATFMSNAKFLAPIFSLSGLTYVSVGFVISGVIDSYFNKSRIRDGLLTRLISAGLDSRGSTRRSIDSDDTSLLQGIANKILNLLKPILDNPPDKQALLLEFLSTQMESVRRGGNSEAFQNVTFKLNDSVVTLAEGQAEFEGMSALLKRLNVPPDSQSPRVGVGIGGRRTRKRKSNKSKKLKFKPRKSKKDKRKTRRI